MKKCYLIIVLFVFGCSKDDCRCVAIENNPNVTRTYQIAVCDEEIRLKYESLATEKQLRLAEEAAIKDGICD